MQLKQKIRDRLMNEWIWVVFIETKAMMVAFVFLQTLSALSSGYYGTASMVWTSYITCSEMVAEGVLTRCEGNIFWKTKRYVWSL